MGGSEVALISLFHKMYSLLEFTFCIVIYYILIPYYTYVSASVVSE